MTPLFTFEAIRSRLAPLIRPIFEHCPPVRALAVAMLKIKQSGCMQRCGMEFTLPCGDFGVTLEAESTGVYEPMTTATLESILSSGKTFVDVGAHVGLFSLPALEWVGTSGRVVAFEPHPDNFVMLLENAARNGLADRLIAVQAAVSNTNEVVKLHMSTFNTGDHQLFHTGGRKSIEVKCTTLDDYFSPGSKVDVIKMDVQGAEAAAFIGMKRVLEENHNIQIIWELSPSQLEDSGSSVSEVLHWLVDLGFTFSTIDEANRCVHAMSLEEILQTCPRDSFVNILSCRND